MTDLGGWSDQRIERDWVGGSVAQLGDLAHLAVEAFQRLERHLGRDWLLARNQTSSGPGPTLQVVHLGQCLRSIENVEGASLVIDKIRAGDASAVSEVEAIGLLSGGANVQIELAPDLSVDGSIKRPDFRIRRAGERWTYVEVTRPDMSDAALAAQQLLIRLNAVAQVRRSFSMELFLRREPAESDEKSLLKRALALAQSDDIGTFDVPGLAIITKEHFSGPVVTPRNFPDEDNIVPRFGAASAVLGGDGTEPQRIVSVRMPFTDDRADRFIKREATQLSRMEQGLIMIDMSAARIAMQGWVPLLRRRLQPTIHTRVGGLCLFAKSTELGTSSLQVLYEIATIPNQHAPHQLPFWVMNTLDVLG